MKFRINGGKSLIGEMPVGGAKNCVLPMLACSVLTEDTVIIENCEKVSDVLDMVDILVSLGAESEWQGNSVVINCRHLDGNIACDKVGKIRASVFLLGPLFARYGYVNACLPGGCAIGSRPIDIHLDGLRRLGAEVTVDDTVCCRGQVHGNDVYLRFPSVGATENLLMCASLCEETTVLYNCACEPEVTALEKMLVSMGAEIYGIGTPVVTIRGRKKLHGVRVRAIPDRIVASTYIFATLCAGGDVWVTGCNPRHFSRLNRMLKDCTDTYRIYSDAVHIVKKHRHKSTGNVITAVYPGFATDMQPLLVAAMCTADGKTAVTEKLFENRLKANSLQLKSMGADITVNGNRVTINGVAKLKASDNLCATDLRGGAALVIASLGAEGESTVNNAHHIERGYFRLQDILKNVGADISVCE